MKRIVLTLILLTLFLSACTSPTANVTKTEETQTPTYTQDVATGGCPRGKHNDPYPGICVLYKDQNSNGECDYGE